MDFSAAGVLIYPINCLFSKRCLRTALRWDRSTDFQHTYFKNQE